VKFENGNVLPLGSLGGVGGTGEPPLAYDINDHGVVVGNSLDSDGQRRAFVYSNGVMTNLGTLGGDASNAFAVNNSGVVVGRARDSNGDTLAFRYETGVMTPITNGTALDINDHGLIVGNLSTGSGFSYHNGVLDVIPGYGAAWAVNNNGLVVGEGVDDNLTYAYPGYVDNGNWKSLAPAGVAGGAWGVNDRDQIVGVAEIGAGGKPTAFLYSNGVIHDVLDLFPADSGWSSIGAYDINDRGQIVGYGFKESQWRAFMLTPTIDTFDLEVTYSNPLVSIGDGDLPAAEVTARFVLEGIGGMPGTFRLEDVVSAYVEFADGVWTELDLASFQMTLGPGGVDDILTLSYNFDPLVTPSGAELSVRNNSFQLYIDGVLPDSGEAFSYFYPDSEQSLSVVPEPSSLLLSGIAFIAVMVFRRRRS